MTGAYFRPADYTYVDDTPIRQMEMLANAYKANYEKAEADYRTYMSTHGDFSSPIKADIDAFNNATVNRVTNEIKNIGDPEWLKTPEGQAAVNKIVSTTDYSKLSQYRQSAENAKQWMAAAQKLKLAGKFNPDWVDNDPSKWDTNAQGVFTDTAPIEYKTAAELSENYFNQLKPGFIRSTFKDGVKYNEYGNTVDDLKTIANASYQDIINTPQGQKYMEQFMKQERMKDPEANDVDIQQRAAENFNTMIVSANAHRTLRPTLKVDEVWLQNRELNHQAYLTKLKINAARAASSNGGDSGTGDSFIPLTQIFTADASNKVSGASKEFIDHLGGSRYPNYKVEYAGIKGTIGEFKNMYKRASEIGAAIGSVDPNRLSPNDKVKYDQMMNEYTRLTSTFGTAALAWKAQQKYKSVTGRNLLDAESNTRQGNFGSTITGMRSTVGEIASPMSTQASETVNGTIFTGKQDKAGYYDLPSTTNLVTNRDLLARLSGKSPEVIKGTSTRAGGGILGGDDYPIETLLSSGVFKNVKIKASNQHVSFWDNKDKTYVRADVRIPMDEWQKHLTAGWGSLIGRQTNESVVKNVLGGRRVTGEDGIDYFQLNGEVLVDVTGNSSVVHALNQDYYDKVGNSTLRKDAYNQEAARSILEE